MGIKDFLLKKASFCKYTWKVVAYIMITGEGHSGLYIWPETPNQDTGTEDVILIIWYKEVMKQAEINPKQYYLPGPSTKKICYASYTSS